MEKYTLKDMQVDFPNDDVCLDHIFREKYPNYREFWRVDGRKSYVNKAGKQVHPLSGTIFEKSSTPLTLWFYAIYLFSISKNGVSAKELQRQTGITYKAAWRMAHKIRSLMADQGSTKLSGVVEADETYMGPKKRGMRGRGTNKAPVLGVVQRGGDVRARVATGVSAIQIGRHLLTNVQWGSKLMTDELSSYKWFGRHYKHQFIKHKAWNWARGEVYTNTIEGFWGQLKRSTKGTYHSVSKKHLQAYVDEFVWRYNRRNDQQHAFQLLLAVAPRGRR